MNHKNFLLTFMLATCIGSIVSINAGAQQAIPGDSSSADLHQPGLSTSSSMLISAPTVSAPSVGAPDVPAIQAPLRDRPESDVSAAPRKVATLRKVPALQPTDHITVKGRAMTTAAAATSSDTDADGHPQSVPFNDTEIPAVMSAPVPPVAASSLPGSPPPVRLISKPSQNTQSPIPDLLASSTLATAASSIVPAPVAAAPKKIEIPVPVMPAPSVSAPDLLVLPLSKTKGIVLAKAVRDVIIGNPDIADIVVRSQTQIYLIGKKVGDTNVFLVDANGELIRKIDIVVQPDADGVQSNIAALLPGEQITAKGMGDSIVLSGTASSDGVAAQAHGIARRFVDKDEKVVSMIRVANEQQVLLRVKVAEIQKTVLKEMGVDNLLSPQTLGPLAFGFATSAIGLTDQIAGAFAVTSSDFDSTVRLLEKQGLVRTLAEPNLLAVSGETASLLAGGEYPVLTPGQTTQNDTIVSVQYKPFGVSLAFIPVVLDAGRINLKVSTEVSALSNDNALVVPFGDSTVNIKSFTTRRANSTVELPSGGGMMIAGLLQNDITSAVNGTPGLMDLPILGALFRSTSFQRNETELVILVSVVLVKPVNPHQLATPTDGFAPSTDLDRYFLGHLQNIYSKRPTTGPNAPQSLQGPLGYIVK